MEIIADSGADRARQTRARWTGGWGRAAVALVLLAALSPAAASAPALGLEEALLAARHGRAELRAAGARVAAARERPAIVGALEDPVIAPAIDHKPVDPMMRSDRSITFEQRFPLSRVNAHRRRAAVADAERYQGEGSRTALRIAAEVAQAFFMLNERRKTEPIVEQQIALAAQLVRLAAARHGRRSRLRQPSRPLVDDIASDAGAWARVMQPGGFAARAGALSCRPAGCLTPPLGT